MTLAASRRSGTASAVSNSTWVARVFARLGERENRSKARIKFLVKKLGLEEFKRLVFEERGKLRHDERWTSFLAELHATDEAPLKAPSELSGARPAGFDAWAK